MRASTSLLVLAVLPSFVMADATAPPAGWKEFAPKNKSYVTVFPAGAKVDQSEDSIVSPKFGQIRIFRAVAERDSGLLVVSQVILPPRLLKSTAKTRQDFFRDMCLDEFRGKVVSEKKVRLGTMPGKEYLIKTGTGYARFRLLGTGSQVFRLLVTGSKEHVYAKDAEIFLGTFKRTPKTGKPSPK